MSSCKGSINVHDHGKTVDAKKYRVQCNYCGKVMNSFCRLKNHLGHVRINVLPCEKVPKDVNKLFRDELEQSGRLLNQVHRRRKKCPDNNVAKKAKCQSFKSEFYDGESGEYENPDSQSAVICDPNEVPSSKQNKRCIGRFFFETGIDFKVLDSPSFRSMMNGIQGPGQVKCKIPSCPELKGWILKDEVKEMQEYVEKIRQSWANTGCSILLDGWIDEKGRNLVSFIVDCPQVPVYLHSSDVSASVDDVDTLQLLLDGVICEVGVENVVQVIPFSTTGWVGAVGKKFMERWKTVFWTVNASHCIELMLDKIASMRNVRGSLEKAKTISKFIHDIIKPFEILHQGS